MRTETLGGMGVDVGAEAFIARRPEVPALLAELGLADRQRGTTGVRPLLYSRRLLHRLPPDTLSGIPSSPESMAGLVDNETLARIAGEPSRPLAFEPGSDPALGALVADRFGPQVVACSVDPLIGGVYAGSAATVGLRSAVPGLATLLDEGASSLTEAVRRALPTTTGVPVFGAITGGYQVLVNALVRSARLRWVQSAVTQIDPAGDGWLLRDASGGHHRADRVVVAVPAPCWPGWPPGSRRVPRLRPAGSATHRRWWWQWRCPPARRSRTTPGYWLPPGNGCTPRRSP